VFFYSRKAISAATTALLTAGLFLSGAGGAFAQSDAKPKRSKARTVLVEPVRLADDKVVVRAIGTGEALKSAALHPSAAGEVVEVAFKAGQRVAKGAALVRLDDKHQRLAVRLARVQVKEAERQLKRLEKLAPSGAASQARLETAQATLESARLKLDQSKAALEDRTVYAPFDGIIGLTDVSRGDRVTEDALIATLDDRSVILVKFNLPEEYAARVKVGDRVSVRPWSMREQMIEGVIDEAGSRIDPDTRVLTLKARIVNAGGAIRPGSSFEVQIAFTGRRYPLVREVAVLWSRDGAYLWRVKDGKAEKIFVKIVRRDRGRVLVDGPLQAGELLVVEGVQGLRVGQKVKAEPREKTP